MERARARDKRISELLVYFIIQKLKMKQYKSKSTIVLTVLIGFFCAKCNVNTRLLSPQEQLCGDEVEGFWESVDGPVSLVGSSG